VLQWFPRIYLDGLFGIRKLLVLPRYRYALRIVLIVDNFVFSAPVVCGVLANVVASMIMHRVSGTKVLLIFSMTCCATSGILGATQPPGTIYWAMSFPAMCKDATLVSN
jgi:hypothetical protein